jgi:predicted RNA-binding Zn-ribbon protein involved in translation (DUF1610 family)
MAPTETPDRPRCPLCGEDVLIDRDTRTRKFFCFVCAHSWKEDS